MAVIATVTEVGIPQSALVGFAITPNLEIIFDTVTTSRKHKNRMHNPAISLVIGWDNEQTVQYEGAAKIPTGAELEKLLPYYFKAFPDGGERRETWKDLVYFCVQPKWIRYSDFNMNTIEEI